MSSFEENIQKSHRNSVVEFAQDSAKTDAKLINQAYPVEEVIKAGNGMMKRLEPDFLANPSDRNIFVNEYNKKADNIANTRKAYNDLPKATIRNGHIEFSSPY